jgi:hypothetical protein
VDDDKCHRCDRKDEVGLLCSGCALEVFDVRRLQAVVDAAVLSARPPVSVNALMPKANPWPKT